MTSFVNPAGPEPVLWKATTATGSRTVQETPFFAQDRRATSLADTPLRLEIHVGDSKRESSHGEKLLAQLRSRGYAIGPSGFVLRVESKITNTADALKFDSGKEKGNVFIPKVNYLWQLVDSQGRVAWSAQATGHFLRQRSKYFKSQLSSSNRVMEDLYDFKGQPVEAAIAGQYVILPASLPWSFAPQDNPN